MAGTQLVLGLTADVMLTALMLALSSAAFALLNSSSATLQQRAIPDGFRGRVGSLFGTVAGGAEALGALAGGGIATLVGIRPTMLIGAVPIATASLWLAWRRGRSQPGAV